MAAITKSVRLPQELYHQIQELSRGQRFTDVVTDALSDWVNTARREQEDELIRTALQGRSTEQIAEEGELVRIASQSGQRVLEADTK